MWQGRLFPSPLGTCLAAGYQLGVSLRERGYNLGVFKTRHLKVPVLSVGNLTVGGTGKTPLAMAIAAHLGGMCRVSVVSRGYKRESSSDPLVVSDGERILVSAKEGGDEPFLMASSLPGVVVVVGGDRYTAARMAVDRFGAEVVLLDDGFQHRRLKKDLELLLVDAEKGFGNSKMLPAGPLREPLSTLVRAQMVVLVRKGDVAVNPVVVDQIRGVVPDIPMETVTMRLRGLRQVEGDSGLISTSNFLGVEVAAFCGVGNPQGFFKMLEEEGMVVAKRWVFGDHHRYSPGEIAEIMGIVGARVPVVTTAKDMVNLPPPPYPPNLFVAELEPELLPQGLIEMVEQAVRGALPGSPGEQ